ncbi:NADH-FMN oxidoreductase RutF, flavin reductase (DIM6/NTAB) family [Chitinophaga jiangningensis]|uniref:NADH-FMN oxidoreductase RutF, flavin reductase (DIM6/NTAB) family n=1 Tax=Chitinophaga jiangningensis TaxID=1419482 RepID=A0A1M7ABD9_9BACT|nr:flavin reductase family protein [Chitinophaga jiangningensis]SHL40000.1 NADH-FMN oxidoreductase RutF, flavin reductase (DIM6/NTAB) family [Chitinophaga jiangningensis]
MRSYRKEEIPVADSRKYLEPTPVVLVSSRYKSETNIMSMGWYTIMEFVPSLVGCMITGANHSYELIRKSKECVINIPTANMLETIVGIGNTTGGKLDKFRKFGLTPEAGKTVSAPIVRECYAHFECHLYDAQMLDTYNFFIFEIRRALVSVYPKYPKTVHYRGDGEFMIAGKNTSIPEKWRPQGK